MNKRFQSVKVCIFSRRMGMSLSSLTFKGSINEAILEAKKQKKLFVVYISGEDVESSRLEESTWTDSNVAESLAKYCIFLHFPGGSTDAAHFSALYPQKSIPCITAIGYNGVQVWQNEGFVDSEDLASSLEKAWLSLHVQETTVTFLTATLASKNSGASTSVSNIASSVEQSSSSTVVPSPLTDGHVQSEEAKPVVISEEKNTELDDKKSSRSYDASKSNSILDGQSSSTEVAKGSPGPVLANVENFRAYDNSSSAEVGSPAPENINDNGSGFPGGSAKLVDTEIKEVEQDEKAEAVNDKQAYALDDFVRDDKPSDVHLNIRLPSGVNLQEKFSVASTLKMVKEYVDENQQSGLGTYDLAIPYPRKVFSGQDLSKSLSELGLLNRQALIVVPHHRATGYHGEASSSSYQTNFTSADSSNGTNGGYFAYVRRILSYMNPFSYLGGGGASSSSSGHESQNGIWQHSPNPTHRNNLAGTVRSYSQYSANQSNSAAGRDDDGKKRQPTTSHFGSNIHTLKHDEDDGRFSDRNAFWNGNSTQYGGDNDGK
ncbi:plant UBX domain-containing protein 11 isoform X3 [Castanea sativa]|uniref:plant UBX domain-containing protein 11 isoform X3 n=2 Tax=Castanea sativa TaxID=21020 RepID=UPI003F64C62E